MGDRGHRQLWVDRGHVKEQRKRPGDQEKGDLCWGGQGTSLASDTFQSRGEKEGDKGRLCQQRQALRCVNESQFKEAEQDGKERG